MGKSINRVASALRSAGVDAAPLEMPAETKTARAAADVLGCGVDQIAKSVIFHAESSDRILLFITAGGNRIDPEKAERLAGEPIAPADASLVRVRTGFVIGGVAPVGHLSPPVAFFDPKLMEFDQVWAAAGSPRHVFPISPEDLSRISDSQISDFTS